METLASSSSETPKPEFDRLQAEWEDLIGTLNAESPQESPNDDAVLTFEDILESMRKISVATASQSRARRKHTGNDKSIPTTKVRRTRARTQARRKAMNELGKAMQVLYFIKTLSHLYI